MHTQPKPVGQRRGRFHVLVLSFVCAMMAPGCESSTGPGGSDAAPADATLADTAMATDAGAIDGASAVDGGAAASCMATGGTVSTGLCCQGVPDFPNTCAVGACGCSPANSHMVATCSCPTGKCFDGSGCVIR